MGYSEQINWFPQLSLNGQQPLRYSEYFQLDPAPEFQNFGYVYDHDDPLQQEVDIETAAERLTEALGEGISTVGERARGKVRDTGSENFYITTQGPYIPTYNPLDRQTDHTPDTDEEEYSDEFLKWLWYDSGVGGALNATMPSSWLYSGASLIDDRPFMAPWNPYNPGVFENEYANMAFDLPATAALSYFSSGGYGALQGVKYGVGSLSKKAVANAAKRLATQRAKRSVSTALRTQKPSLMLESKPTIKPVAKPRIVVRDNSIIQPKSEIVDPQGRVVSSTTPSQGVIFDPNGRLISTSGLQEFSAIDNMAADYLYLDSPTQLPGMNSRALDIKWKGLLNQDGLIPFVKLGYPEVQAMWDRLGPQQRHILTKTPITTSDHIYDVQRRTGLKFKKGDAPQESAFRLYVNKDGKAMLMPGTEFIPGDLNSGVLCGIIELNPYDLVAAAPFYKINPGRLVIHEGGHAINFNTPYIRNNFHRMTADKTALQLGLPTRQEFRDAQWVQKIRPKQKSQDRLYDYLLGRGAEEIRTRGTELKTDNVLKGRSPRFDSNDELMDRIERLAYSGHNNNMTELYNLLNMGGDKAITNVRDMINKHSWALIPVGGGIGSYQLDTGDNSWLQHNSGTGYGQYSLDVDKLGVQ